MKYLKLYEELEDYSLASWLKKNQEEKPEKIITLNVEDKLLRSLKGIENLINLEKFECRFNNLTDLKGIENCTKLKYFACSHNHNLNDLSDIKNLIDLTFLAAFKCDLTNLEDIKNLINLEELFIGGNRIETLDGLENLYKLKRLGCSSLKLKSADAIKNLNIHYVNFGDTIFELPLPKEFAKYYSSEQMNKFKSYEFQKQFLEEHPEKIADLIPVGFDEKIIEEYKDLIEFFGIKN